jgi:DNA-directed RNA polymerase specialized sigma subunit
MKNTQKKFKQIDAGSIIKFQDGDVSAANNIINFYSPRIKIGIQVSYSTQNLGSHISIEDLIQEGLMHFLDAGHKFDVEFYEDKKNNVSHFFNFCIKKMHWRLLDYVRLLKRRYSKTLESTALLNNYSVDTGEESMPDILFKNHLNKALDKLSSRDRSICQEILTTENISDKNLKKLGLNKVYCFSIYRNFKKKFTEKTLTMGV